MTIAGDIVAHLFASTTGTDSDWVVKLIDVYPQKYEPDHKMGGYELMIANDVLRGRFRNSFEKPEPIVANQVTPFTIDLHTNDHVFQKGHRIMVQVQSTWFPIIDRNPQKYVPNIFEAKASRLSEGHPANLSFEAISFERGDPRGRALAQPAPPYIYGRGNLGGHEHVSYKR